MKKLSNRDWAIALIIGALSFILGWATKHIVDSRKEPIMIENPVNTALIKRNDSLEAVVAQRELIIAENDKKQFKHDSTLIMNNRNLAKEYEKIKNLDDSSRAIFVELALKRANIRR